MPKTQKIYYTEILNFSSWMLYIFPVIFKDRKSRQKLFYFDASFMGRLSVAATAWAADVSVEQCDFSIAQFRDEEGTLVWKKVMFEFPKFQNMVKNGASTIIPRGLID